MTPTVPRVDVLLSTYNGGKYLRELLSSLAAQDYSNFGVLVRDDGSRDDTVALLQAFATEHPQLRLQVFAGEENLGPARSFLELMRRSDAAYFAFADQDDVWYDDKLSRLVAGLTQEEAQHAMEVPMLAHCDLRVVDQHGTVISSSFWSFSDLNPRRNRLKDLLVANTVTGCAMLVNRAARNLAVSVSTSIYMHDRWLALICALAGHIVVVDAPLVDYRQHGDNVVGAQRGRWMPLILGRLRRLCGPRVSPGGAVQQDARYHLARFAEALLQLDLDWRAMQDQYRLLESVSHLSSCGMLRRWNILLSRGLWVRPLLKNYGLFF